MKPEVAARQLAEDQARAQETSTGVAGQPYSSTGGQTGVGHAADSAPGSVQPVSASPKRFFGSVALDPTRVGRDAGRVAEVIQHLAGLMGSKCQSPSKSTWNSPTAPLTILCAPSPRTPGRCGLEHTGSKTYRPGFHPAHKNWPSLLRRGQCWAGLPRIAGDPR